MPKTSLLRSFATLTLTATLAIGFVYAPSHAIGMSADGSGMVLSGTSRSDSEIDQTVCRLTSLGDYVEGEAIVCRLGSHVEAPEIIAQSDDAASGLLAHAETLSSVTARQYAEATGESISTQTELGSLTAQSADEPVEILKVCDYSLDTDQLLRELLRDPQVLSAEPNYLADLASEEEVLASLDSPQGDDEGNAAVAAAASEQEPEAQSERVASSDLTGYQWFSDGVDSMLPQHVDAENPGVHAPNWNDSSKTNASGVVAIMDTGVDYTHPDLAGVMYHFSPEQQAELGCGEFGYAPRRDDPTDPMDYGGHGTHCTGIVAAEWNDFGVSGIANGVKVTSVCLAGLGRDTSYSCDTIIRGYDFLVRAADAGVDIRAINRSLTVGVTTTALDVMARAAGDRGIVTLEATGNNNNDIDVVRSGESMYQANPYILRVCAASLQDGRANFSNYGKYTTDLFAPGSCILSTVPSNSEDKLRYFPQADADPLYLKTTFDEGSPDITPTANLQIDEASGGDVGVDGDGSSLKLSIRKQNDVGSHFFLDIPVGSLGKDEIQDVSMAIYCPGFVFSFGNGISILLADGTYADSWSPGVMTACYNVTGGWGQFSLHISDPGAMEQELGHVVDSHGNTCIRLDVCIDASGLSQEGYSELAGEFYLDMIAVGKRDNGAFMPYCYMNGTSMATPCATGCAAIVSSTIDASSPAERAAGTVRTLKAAVRQAEGYVGFCKQNGQIDLNLLGSAVGLVPVIESARTVGDTLVLGGSNFSTSGTLLLGGEEVEVLSWSDDQIEVAWPEGLSSNLVPITVRADSGAEACRALILEAPEGTPNSALLYERDLAPIDSPRDGRKETTSPMSLIATEDGTLYAAVTDTDDEIGRTHEHTVHYLVRSNDQGASWSSIELPQALKDVKLAVGDGRVFVWGSTPADNPTARFAWHLYGLDVTNDEFELLGSYEGGAEVSAIGSLAYVGGNLYLIDNYHLDNDYIAPSHMRLRCFDAEYRLPNEGLLLDHGYVAGGRCRPPLVTTVGNSIYVCGMNSAKRVRDTSDRLVGLERVDVGVDGSLTCTDLSSTLSGLTEMPDDTGISIAATEESVFLIGEVLGALLPSNGYHTDTFVLRSGASSFEPYERTLSHALLECTSSLCADGWLYAFGVSRNEESPIVGRATRLETDPEPGPEPEPQPGPAGPVQPDNPPAPQPSKAPSSSGARASTATRQASSSKLPRTGDSSVGVAAVFLAGFGTVAIVTGIRRRRHG